MSLPTYAERRQNAQRLLRRNGAPMTPAHLTKLAKQYEASYRRWRASKSVPAMAREHLLGAVQTARAFYSLAREQLRKTEEN